MQFLHQQRIKLAAVEGRSAIWRKIRDKAAEIYVRFVRADGSSQVALPPEIVQNIEFRMALLAPSITSRE